MVYFDTYIEKSAKSIFRFEGLQDYSAMDGDEMIEDFIKTGKLSLHPRETEWWQDIKKKNESGIKTHRVRLVVFPLTDYTKWELAWHREVAKFAKEDLRIIEDKDFNKIFSSLPDFYIIDDKYAFPLQYGPKGKFLGDRIIEGDEVKKYIEYKKKLLENSVPIWEWKS